MRSDSAPGGAHNKQAKLSEISGSESGSQQQQQQQPAADKLTIAAAKLQANLADACYSLANVVLILAGVVALVVLVNFTQDELLYDYGEHLLPSRFFHQLTFMMVVCPLVLLIPLTNALSVLLCPSSRSDESWRGSALALKLLYETLALVLVLLALVFVVAYIRPGLLAEQLELEIRRHMQLRYENNFSYEFLDKIQEQYECCDPLWYRANLPDDLPFSCYRLGSNFSFVHQQTCWDSIGRVVGTRCSIVALCLLLMLVALVGLMAIDAFELVALRAAAEHLAGRRRGRYKLAPLEPEKQIGFEQKDSGGELGQADEGWPRDQQPQHVGSQPTLSQPPATATHSSRQLKDVDGGKEVQWDSSDSSREFSEFSSRRPAARVSSRAEDQQSRRSQSSSWRELARADDKNNQEDSRRPQSLWSLQRQRQQQQQQLDSDSECQSAEWQSVGGDAASRASPSAILTRAHYVYNVDDVIQQRLSPASLRRVTQLPASEDSGRRTPIKSALKKSASQRTIELTSDEDEDADEDLDEYVRQLRSGSSQILAGQQQQQQAARRSLLSVRFADE